MEKLSHPSLIWDCDVKEDWKSEHLLNEKYSESHCPEKKVYAPLVSPVNITSVKDAI